MSGTKSGSTTSATVLRAEQAAATAQALAQDSLIELKIITRHLSEIADAAFGEDDISLDAD